MTIHYEDANSLINKDEQLRRYGAIGKGWSIFVLVILILSSLPLLALIYMAGGDSSGVWPHLVANVLPNSILVTVLLLAGVGFGTMIIGTGTAWLVSRHDFPLRNVLQWGLILPLAIPTYISAYTWTEFSGYTGPLQEWVRAIGGFETSRDYWFPDIRSVGGAIFLISLVLFPYVYLPSRLSFSLQSVNLFDVAKLLGAGPLKLFFKVALPAARPAIAVGVILSLMETLNDIGAVEHLGVRTLTFSIFDTWLNRSSLAGAAQLSLFLLAFIAGFIVLEKYFRSQQSYHDPRQGRHTGERVRLRGAKAFLASATCFLPVALGFAVPLFQLVRFSIQSPGQFLDGSLYLAAWNSVYVAMACAVICMFAGFILAYANRRGSQRRFKVSSQIASLGYAVPGTILAIGIVVVMTGFDNWFAGVMNSNFGVRTGLLISGSSAIVVFACSVRFLAVAIGNIEAGYTKISPNLTEAARTLGHAGTSAMWLIELPLIGKSMLVAAILVFVETMKELSATLLLRPFNFDTLSTFVYTRASRAVFEEASFAALLIVLIGLLPVYLLTRMFISEHKR